MNIFRLPPLHSHRPKWSDWYIGSQSGSSASFGTPEAKISAETQSIRVPFTEIKDGVTFKGLSARWTAPWTNIIAVRTRSVWEGTSAGGYSAGVRLTLRDGRTRDIPDYLVLPRADLAHLIDMRRKQASNGA